MTLHKENKLFYVPACNGYGRFYVISAKDKHECELKIKKAIQEEKNEYELEKLKFALKTKKGWEECKDGFFKGEWA